VSAKQCAARLEQEKQLAQEVTILLKLISITPPSVVKMYLYTYMPSHVSVDNNQHQEDLINRQDNLPLIEEATERELCGSRIIRF
jgi:hypothetical protein